MQHFIVKGDVILEVKEGDALDENYRVEVLAADEITLLYLPLGSRTQLPIARAADAPPAPAVAAQPSVSPALAASLPPSEAASVLSAAPPLMRAAQLKAPRTFHPPTESSKPPR